ncbi:WRKY transcription factor WRKY24-like [Punica granatum]|uniref:WRKY domain-containing protein n=2 Tax=Punica granatum TaxID=22663 RepID=A0A218WV13_PUNGR|nr:WRKY transcription factor WRKY24-like [Punica granatum]OWM76674.1 hypothetical protein CDL15_Pgr009239 [Punica granatum]PKI54916.1 hypothetical protein CRG98_024698 [Punica granatum]
MERKIPNVSWGFLGPESRTSSRALSPPPISPSSYFTVPPGLVSPVDFMDSAMLFPTSNDASSPSFGDFAGEGFNWRSNYSGNLQQSVKGEDRNFGELSCQVQARPSSSMISVEVSSSSSKAPEPWNYPKSSSQFDFSSEKKAETSGINPVQGQANPQSRAPQPFHSYYTRDPKKTDDGYNWRKYGQKQVKGSENPRSYYKCTFPNCQTKKKVETSLDGHVTEIVYKGTHSHPKPQSNRRNAFQSIQPNSLEKVLDQSVQMRADSDYNIAHQDSSDSIGDGEFEPDSRVVNAGGGDEEGESDSKRRKGETEYESFSAHGNSMVREPKVIVQTMSEIDILDDGYRWRKYGQKVVKGNHNPRSYYKCTSTGCPVRKHVERASHDMRAVITTYEGKHNHDVPAARGSGSHMLNRPQPSSFNTIAPSPLRPSTVAGSANHKANYIGSVSNLRPQGSASSTQSVLEMLQNPNTFAFTSGMPTDFI